MSATSGLRTQLAAEGLDPAAWSNDRAAQHAAHDHDYDKVIVVAAGSIAFGLPGQGSTIHLGVGDRLELPAGTAHDAEVGSAGVTCLEAHLATGRLTAVAHRPAGTW